MAETREKPRDPEIVRLWTMAERLARPSYGYRSALEPPTRGPGLGERLACRLADDLEARGVTEADLERLGL